MINICISLNRKNTKIFLLLALFCVIAVLFLCASAARAQFNGKTNEQRIAYLESLGYSVITAPSEVKTVTIPEVFGDVYQNYNQLQRKAGFDLWDYRGRKVTIYTYPMLDESETTNLHLIVFRGEIIGGDICGAALGSQILPLAKRS